MEYLYLPAKISSTDTDQFTVNIPPSLGQGSFVTRHYVSGISLMVSNFKFNQPTTVKTMNPKQSCGFGFFLSGDLEARLSCFNNAFVVKDGQSGLFSLPEMDHYTEVFAPRPVLRYSVYLSPTFLSKLTDKDPEQLPKVLTADPNVPYRAADKITPLMQAVLSQITNCTYQGTTRQLFMEGKLLELIAHKIDQLDAQNQRLENKKMKLTANEVEGIRHAAQLLTHNLEHPPSITELSGVIGMCRSKFYKCFQSVFNVTPFEYLHRRRMETASRLIREGEINVTQAAYSVGYSSLSHFSKAFKKHFGVTPSKSC